MKKLFKFSKEEIKECLVKIKDKGFVARSYTLINNDTKLIITVISQNNCNGGLFMFMKNKNSDTDLYDLTELSSDTRRVENEQTV